MYPAGAAAVEGNGAPGSISYLQMIHWATSRGILRAMATDMAATADKDRKVRRQAQAQQHADEGGGGGIAFLLVAAGLGAFGVYELTRAKCPTGYTYKDGKCVQDTSVPPSNNPPPTSATPPAGYPAQWCSYTEAEKTVCVVWRRLLQRMPIDASGNFGGPGGLNAYNGGQAGLQSGVSGVAQYIVWAPQGEFINDVLAEVANPGGQPYGAPPSSFYGLSYEDKILSVTFARFLQRWPDPAPTSAWLTWRHYYETGGIIKLSEAFYDSAEFRAGVPAEVAALACH